MTCQLRFLVARNDVVVAAADKPPPTWTTPSVGMRRTAVAPGEHPAKSAEGRTLAPAVVSATALNCSHALHEPTDNGEQQVEPGH